MLGEAKSARERTERADEARRDEARLKAEYQARLFREVVTAYNGIKSVRRTLRAEGFRKPEESGEHAMPNGDDRLSADDVAAYNTRMRSLIESQLSVERVAREVRAQPTWFERSQELQRDLKILEEYVAEITDEWEKTDGRITEGANPSDVHSLKRLQGFLEQKGARFKEEAADPLFRIEEGIRTDLYGGSVPSA